MRDNGDDSGQTIRQWHMKREAGHIVIRPSEDASGGFLMIRVADVATFVSDLEDLADFEPDDDPKPEKAKGGK